MNQDANSRSGLELKNVEGFAMRSAAFHRAARPPSQAHRHVLERSGVSPSEWRATALQ